MRINIKQIFILLIILIIIFPPINYEEGYKYGSKDQLITYREFEGFKFIYFVLTNSINAGRYSVWTINYPFLILELVILSSIFLFIYLGKTNSTKKIEDKIKKQNKSILNPSFFISNLFQKVYPYHYMKVLGGIFIFIGLADFLLSLVGINLTPFLPRQIARFTPIIFGIIGGLLLKQAAKEEQLQKEEQQLEQIKKNLKKR